MALVRAVDAAKAAHKGYEEALAGLADARKAANGRARPNPDIDALEANVKRLRETFLAAYREAIEKLKQVNSLIDDIMSEENWSVVSVTDDDDNILSDDDADSPKEADDAAAAMADNVESPLEDKKK